MTILLPITDRRCDTLAAGSDADRALLARHLDQTLAAIAEALAPAAGAIDAAPHACAERIVHALLGHRYNYQSRGKVAQHVPDAIARMTARLAEGRQPALHLLLHGGYRAGVGPDSPVHTFAPDMTEVMLIRQIARFNAEIRAVCPVGVHVTLVINNGVAAFTNGISYDRTNGYVAALRDLIVRLGAQAHVAVLNQHELGDFAARMADIAITPAATITAFDHAMVERFVGRACSEAEARLKLATYLAAERAWGAQVAEIARTAHSVVCRQVASPTCLSFRPFPGGAMRIQNGALGFAVADDTLRPTMLTPANWAGSGARAVPLPCALFDDRATPRLRDAA